MSTWDPVSVRKSFASIAANAERYVDEIKDRIRRDPKRDSPTVQELIVEHSAKWFVYDWFSVSAATETRESLIAEAKQRIDHPPASGNYSKEVFNRYWNLYLKKLAAEIEVS